jgi:hypothetical protein
MNSWRVLVLLSLGFVFVAHTLPVQADTVTLTGVAGINGVDAAFDSTDSGTDGGAGGSATAIAGPLGDPIGMS